MLNKKLVIIFLSTVLFTTFFMAAGRTAAAADIKVLLLPFEMHGTGEISSLRREVMETFGAGLDSPGVEIVGLKRVRELMADGETTGFDERTALTLSGSVTADFAVLGSITRLGENIELNWKIFDLRDSTALSYYNASATEKASIFNKIKRQIRPMTEKMITSVATRPVSRTEKIDAVALVGNRRVDSEAVLGKLSSRAGEPFSTDKVKEDIEIIYGMGYFEDIQVDLSQTASGTELRFIVKERPFIKKIIYSGNDDIDNDRIEEVTRLKENTVVDHVLIKETAEILRALYSSEGFYLAEIKPEVTIEDLDATVTYHIVEGGAVRVKRITIIGNEEFSDRVIRKQMETKKKGVLSFMTGSGKFSEQVFHSDLQSILSHYYNNGYIHADITDNRVQLSEDNKWFYITIAIEEGDQFKVGKTFASGDILESRTEILDELGLEAGDVFDRSKLSEGLDAIRFLYGDDGYANADVRTRTNVNEEEKTIDIEIDIAKNELVYIERIDITGNTRTRDKVIRREVEIGEGDLYSSTSLKRSKANLRRLGYFETLEIHESPGSTTDKLKLNVDMNERPTGSFSLGLGYSSVDKIVATAEISQANFLGTGIGLEIGGTVSASSSTYSLSLKEPWLFDKPLSAGIDVYDTEKEYPDFDMDTQGGGLLFGFPLYKHDTKGYLKYKYEIVDIKDVSEDATDSTKEAEGESVVSSIKAIISHDSRDDAFFAREGIQASASTEVAGGGLGGTTDFIKYEVSFKKYFPMPWNTTLTLKTAGGYVQSFAGSDIPIYERYYIGGINTIRGFETREVGPQDAETGEYTGGDSMVVANVELILPVFNQKNLRAVLFYDAGNAYDDGDDFGVLRHGAGAGLRWYSPLGPLRLEWGFNLDPRDDEDTDVWEFAIGATF